MIEISRLRYVEHKKIFIALGADYTYFLEYKDPSSSISFTSGLGGTYSSSSPAKYIENKIETLQYYFVKHLPKFSPKVIGQPRDIGSKFI